MDKNTRFAIRSQSHHNICSHTILRMDSEAINNPVYRFVSWFFPSNRRDFLMKKRFSTKLKCAKMPLFINFIRRKKAEFQLKRADSAINEQIFAQF